ncbi:MAG: hypothetical protein RLP15_05470 [Cryomorphaceae bacterium]
MKHIFILLTTALVITSCVPQKKFAALQAENARLIAMAPAAEAKAKLEASEVLKQQEEIQQLKAQVQALAEAEKQYRSMMEAGEMPQPTPEQMRMQELKYAESMNKPIDPENGPMEHERSELQRQYEQAEFQQRMVIQAMRATLSDYKATQVSYDIGGGRSVVCISAKELFEPGKAELSEMGKGLVSRIAIALEGSAPLHYTINAITEGDMNKAADQAGAVYAQLAKEKGNVRMPKSIGAVPCDKAAGITKISCDRIELSLEQDYELIMGQVNTALR